MATAVVRYQLRGHTTVEVEPTAGLRPAEMTALLEGAAEHDPSF